MEYIIAFKNTNSAIKAEQLLLERRLGVGVLPLPSQIRAGCGICLRIRPGEIERAITILAENRIDGVGLFLRERDGKSYRYEEITEQIARSADRSRSNENR